MRRTFAILCTLSAIHVGQARADATVGTTREVPDGTLDFTPAVADVNVASGQYSPRIALEVPVGPGGFTPDLALVYSTGRSTGSLGAGWGLSFESGIARKSALGGLPAMTATDTFWIDGQKLIAIADGTYRTEQSDFVVYRKIVSTGVLIGWTGTKDGRVTTYGKASSTDTAAANAVEYRDETVPAGSATGASPVMWRLSTDRNPFGATLIYRYTIPDISNLGGKTSRRHQIDVIQYAQSGAALTEISFGYEPRNDVRRSYANGPERIESKRLRRIVVKRTAGSSSTTHYYLFLYRDAAHSPESLLTEVKRVAVANSASPPTPVNEASLPSVSLGRFEYSDSTTTWSDRAPLALSGDPPLVIDASHQYYSMSLLADVDADALADLVVFNDECHMSQQHGGNSDIPDPQILICVPDHRVYINTIQESRVPIVLMAFAKLANAVMGTMHPIEVVALGSHVFVYNAARSQQVTDFFGPIHSQTGSMPIAITDLGRDGYADLIKPARLSTGSADGWSTTGVAANWSTDALENESFADVDGDGYPDLVGQDSFRTNTGVSPYIPIGLGTSILDPVVADHQSADYDATSADCLDHTDTGIILRFDYPVPDQTHPNDPVNATTITAAEWVWRNTVNADFNGDGLMDRLISVPFLRQEDPLESPGGLDLWVRDDATCGVHDALYLGDGRGHFVPAGYGIGGPMSREEFVNQTRSINNGPGQIDVTNYAYHVNHFALADVDADGRGEITQYCSGDTFLALADQGIGDWHGWGLGYQVNYATGAACPSQFTAAMPEQYFGLSMFDYHYSTTADIDGDGMADLFQYTHPYGDPDEVVTDTNAPWEGWSDGPMWRRNQRTTAQNRLTSITNAHGGRTTVTWAWSAADPGNHFATNVEHVASVTDASGRTAYSFENGAYDAGEFMGFGRVETLLPHGATLVETFSTGRALRNKPSTEELYDSGGRLKNLRVSVFGSEEPTVVSITGIGWDGWAPYYNPLLRRCEWEFGYLNNAVPLAADIDGYIAKCEGFTDESGPIIMTGIFDSRPISAVMRGGDPYTLAHNAAERRELVAFRDLLNGRSPSGICTAPPGTDNFLPARSCRRFTTTPGDTATATVFGPDTGPTVAVTFGTAPHATRMDLAFNATGLSTWVLHGLVTTSARMFVNEYSYDVALGHVLEHRELRDVSTTADSLIHNYQYSTYDPALDGAHMIHETTADRLGHTFENIDYSNFQSGSWKSRTEHDTTSAATRLRKRTFSSLGDVTTVTNPANETTTYSFSNCGPQLEAIDPLGYRKSVIVDAACRVTTLDQKWQTLTIARTTYDLDGYGRPITETTTPSFGSGAMPTVVRRYAYDDASGSTSPASVVIEAEADGSTTLAKTYVDAWGRVIRSTRCAGGGSGGVGLDATYPCDPETEVVSETTFDAATGDAIAVIGPYLTTDILRPTTASTYDEFGRKVVGVDEFGRSTTLDFGLGRRAAVDPLTRRTEVVFDTLTESTNVDGVSQRSSTRDAFGRQAFTIDAAGNRTDIYYDGYNRKREELGPAVQVLASGSAGTVTMRPSTTYAYDLADRLLSRTDPAGRVTSSTYDVNGRLRTLTRSGALIETRTYTDGGYGVRKVVVTDNRLGANREEHGDGLGRIWKQVAFDATVTTTDYDIRGRAFRTTLPWGEVTTTRPHDGGLTSVTTTTRGAVVATTTTTFDAGGRPITTTDPDGQILTHEYDLAGRLVTSWQGSREVAHHTYDYAGRPSEVRNNGATTCFTYDRLDHVTLEESGCVTGGFIVTPQGGRGLVNVQRTYTTMGQLDTVNDGTGAITNNDYDAGGRLTAVETFDAGGTSLGRRTFDYDAVGNQTRTTDELGLVALTNYDAFDRIVSVDPANGSPITTTYKIDAGSWVLTTTSATGEISSRRTDAMGRSWRACDTDGVCIDQQYQNGRLTSRERRSALGVVLATQYVQYDPSSTRVVREWDWVGAGEIAACGGSVPNGCAVPHVERSWTTAGRPATVVDAQGNVTTYGYAPDGSAMLSTVTQTGMPTITLGYDVTYPLVTQRTFHPSVGTDVIETTTYERNLRVDRIDRALNLLHEVTTIDYDGAGRTTLNQLTRGTESIAITDGYDGHGKVVSRTYAVNTVAGTYNGVLRYGWRKNGQLETMTYPSTKVVSYAYDAGSGRFNSMTYNGTPVFEALSPDASGRAATLRYDNNAVRVVRRFDTAGRESGRDVFGTTPAKRTEGYAYDSFGRLQRIDVSYGVTVGASVFAYNDRDRLTTETHTLGTDSRSVAYSYDALTGLRWRKADTTNGSTVTTDYSYGEGNRLATVDAVALGWDGFGRQTSDAAGRSFVFGLADQLLSIEEAGLVVESNLYASSGLRMVRTTPAGGTEYYLPGVDGQIVEHISSTRTEDYLITGGGTVVGTLDPATNNVTAMVNSITGSPYRIGERTIDHLYVDATAFGETIRTDGTLDEIRGFHGMLASSADEIKIAGVRAYDTTTGRFLTADPLGLGSSAEAVDAGDLYRYAQDNPVAMSDPTGFAPFPSGKMADPCLQTADGGCLSRDPSYEEQRRAMGEAWAADKAERDERAANLTVIRIPYSDGHGAFYLMALTHDAGTAESSESTSSRSPGKLEKTSEPAGAGGAGMGGGESREEDGGGRSGRGGRGGKTGEAALDPGEVVRQGTGRRGRYSEEVIVVGKRPIGAKILDGLQFVLDIAGLVDPVGPVFDVTNAGISLLRGDKLSAGLSLASAIPVAGTFIASTKFARKMVKTAAEFPGVASNVKRIWGAVGMGRELLTRGPDGKEIAVLFDNLDQVRRAQEYDAKILNFVDPALNGNNYKVINGRIAERWHQLQMLEEGATLFPSQIGRQGLDTVYLDNFRGFLDVDDVKGLAGFKIGDEFSPKMLSYNRTLRTWQGTADYILGNTQRLAGSSDAALRYTGDLLGSADAIRSSVWVMDRVGNFTHFELGTMYRFDNVWDVVENIPGTMMR